jgi:malate/lactate dehydrogenase
LPGTILIIGCAGSVGHDMMYLIAATRPNIRVVGADVNEEKGRLEIGEALHIAHNLGNYPDLSFRKIDLFDVPGTAEALREMRPTVICNLASLGSWWVTRLLPVEVYEKIGPIGPWLPNHLTLAHKLMQAVKRSGIETMVVNGAYPDLTNVVLGKIGLAPTCGGGNMDLGVSRVRRIVAGEMGVPVKSVTVYGVGHHGSFYTAKMGGPYWLRIIVDGEDVSDRFPNKRITRLYQAGSWAATTQYRGPLIEQMRTASSFLKHVLALHYDTREVYPCVVAPNGLPGGYPARLSADGAKVVLPGISLEKAVEINEAGGRIDGIDRVKGDGTVVFVEENVRLMREVVGYECEELRVSEAEERAKELNSKLRKLYEKYNIK